MSELEQQFITLEQAERRRQRLLVDYPQFSKWDQDNRQIILAPVKSTLEAWFGKGVTYGRDNLLGFVTYTNAPMELRRSLIVARGAILINILEWKGVPKYMGAQLLVLVWAIPKAQSGLNREIKTAFEQRLFPIPYGLPFETRHMEPMERINFISNKWYDLQAQELYYFVSKVYPTKADEWGLKSIPAVEKQVDLDQRLTDLGLNPREIYIYLACKHFEDGEVGELSALLGSPRTADAIRMFRERIDKKLE